jgi:carbamoyl-phosphate synthase large subunit
LPKRTDIRKILIIGSGPIVIGQACEFDYSGTQACKALKEEGYELVLVNSNPATIMTDPEMADRTYIEPITPEVLTKIIEMERPDAILPTLGGQTALNMAVRLSEMGVLDKFGVELIGAKLEAIKKAEDRELFKREMIAAGLDVPRSGYARSVEGAKAIARRLGLPVIVRPSFTLGGEGSGIAYNIEELEEIVSRGLEYSPVKEVLIEESVLGWKEYELEVMRDSKDNVVIVCSIENFNPMGIHTGDSITVAPAQTLTDKEYQLMRDTAIRVMRRIGVDTGGSNIQFAVNPESGRMVVIEMNPRVSRSSALASKATGFPIAKIAAKLAVGYTLDEIPNDITRKTPASFEPAIDYVVVKIPRWAFEKFPEADPSLTTQMKSIGEAMAIGRTFKEALQKAIRSLEIDRYGLGCDGKDPEIVERLARGEEIPPRYLERFRKEILEKLMNPDPSQIFYIKYAMMAGIPEEEIYRLTKIDRWFLGQIREIVEMEMEMRRSAKDGIQPSILREAKRYGFSDRQIAHMLGTDELSVRRWRKSEGIEAVFKPVDTCAAEFEAYTPYYYSTYDGREDEVRISGDKERIIVLGSGPNRIGQGIEFDYCCVHAVKALKEAGYEAIMVNCNPETVSTDYDVSDRLYFEPLTLEDVLSIVEREEPKGVILQFGGQTPLKLAVPLSMCGVRILGTSPDSIDIAEDRERFGKLLSKLGIPYPPSGTAESIEEAKEIARRIGYPVLIRPSYVLGGRAMEIAYDEESLEYYMMNAVEASPERPVLVDRFLEDAIEVDVDAVADSYGDVVIAGIMEHIEEAGIHSGDSACVIPPYTLSDALLDKIREYTYSLARELKVVGLINIQFAVKNDVVYVLEVNPRASRTVPFVSKATGIPWAKIAVFLMLGRSLKELGINEEPKIGYFAVKEPVFPFVRFKGVDPVLGPEMRSTGEAMGMDEDFGRAYAKSLLGANVKIPLSGNAFISVRNKDKRSVIFIAKKLYDMGFGILATSGTAKVLANSGIPVRKVLKIHEGRLEGKPHILDRIKNGEVDLIINTPEGKGPKTDEYKIRREAIIRNILCITTISGAMATVHGIESLRKQEMGVRPIQDYYKKISDFGLRISDLFAEGEVDDLR